MRRHKYEAVWILIIAATLVLGVAYYYGTVAEKVEKEPAVYSVVLYQNTDNEWETLMDGIDQAKKDYRVKIRYANLAEKDTAVEQMEMIEHEIQAGAQGIVLAAVDSRGLKTCLEGKHIQVPVISVETGIDGPVTISADNYEMGRTLGEKILADMEADHGKKMVTVIYEYMHRESVKERYRGLTDVLHESGEDIFIQPVTRQKGDFSLSLFVGKSFRESGDYVAALDKYSTQEAAKAWNANSAVYRQEGREIKIYGIGNTAQTVSNLDGGSIQALVYQNEFNMGYEAIRALAEKEKKGYMTETFDIKSKLVTRETLYESENERLLFPNS